MNPGNGQGSFYFLSVSTGRVLNQLHAAALKMPDNIIHKIHRMAWQQKNNHGLSFAERNLNLDEYDDDDDYDDDETYRDNDNDNPDDNNDEPYHHNDNNDDDNDDDDDESYHHHNNSDDDDEEDNDDNDNHDGDEGGVDNNDDNASDGIGNDPPMVGTPEDNEVEGDEPLNEDISPLNDVVERPDNPPGEIPVVWHVDNLKVSHVDATEVQKFVRQVNETFVKDTPCTVSCGQVHDYLGMTLDFRTKREVQINMEHYIDMML